ncbi:LOG family protein [Amphritea balenae]|uniref:Cytokinin riboside 5'-monophosphate phosphoribohydrolase n=1 Tax=Amphritea balenae TaxID=452629 RepID=A0A3P1SWH6_9GAMM|nr:TIGR00730 family Rossman fold protein [Amphritea balenae]RRD01388.1 TIGR00730 family Rossman fold protein [Amphritea balenae]GGK57485.1 cytokinin riboside 5'-monophosphate phosphoribohydrolase [Amphritea balenae]
MTIKLAVYCGASSGRKGGSYQLLAEQLGVLLAKHNIELVYGGASVGLMGIVADAVLSAGGQVHGVMPQVLIDKEQAHNKLSELHVVEDIHQRKAMMMELSDAFIALPGGTGTLEELFEVWAWRQIGIHSKPFGLLNIDGYYDHLLRFLDHAQQEAFIRSEYREYLLTGSDPEALLQKLINAV